jgi:hypothetical protein
MFLDEDHDITFLVLEILVVATTGIWLITTFFP